MTLTERCLYFKDVFDMLQATNSSILKRQIVDDIKPECKEDFEYIVEVLTGKHVYGYSYWPCVIDRDPCSENNTIKDVLEFLQEPMKQHDLSINNIARYVKQTAPWYWFFEPIVNRTLKIGIGKSVLPKDGMAPMLAKKYEGKIKFDKAGYVITEKLDGNRCVASYENNEWVFRSRNGKLMHVNFDMGDLPKEFVYDGEVMSIEQTKASIQLHQNLAAAVPYSSIVLYGNDFSGTSGLINRHTLNKNLVYNIFDIMVDDVPYIDRRHELYKIAQEEKYGDDIRILPPIAHISHSDLEESSAFYLHHITNMGGEGLMINRASGIYNHKRTDDLLKLKKVQTIDMKVIDFDWGTGKYECMVGALKAQCITDDGKIIACDIGTGLSDEQRLAWAVDPNKIIGKIVEVAYFSLSQTSAQKGSDAYSLRFPRLKSVRKDKVETSEY